MNRTIVNFAGTALLVGLPLVGTACRAADAAATTLRRAGGQIESAG